MYWAVWLRLGRVSNLPTVWSNVLCGLAITGRVPAWPWVVALCAVFSLYYVAGMYLNDAFDRHVDAHERPSRPIPSGQAPAWLVFTLGFLGLAAAVGATAMIALKLNAPGVYRATACGFALSAFIVGYNLHHKQNPVSPVIMGLCRVFVYITVAMVVLGAVEQPLIGACLALLFYLIGLTYTAKQETLQRVQNIWPVGLMALAPAYGIYLSFQRPTTLGFVILLCAWVVYSLRFLWHQRRRSIPAAVVRLIAGIALVDAMLINGAGLLWLAGIAVSLCSMTRAFQRLIPGT
jgi:4-hydroxybenzoate polyprenyltransferase